MTYCKKISETEKSYFAGLFDGEGCIMIHRSGTGYSLRVMLNITYASVLYEMKHIFGGEVYKNNMDKLKNCESKLKEKSIGHSPENNKQKYLYQVHGKEAWVFLKIIEPYCKEKREQAKVGIEFYNGFTDRRGKGKSKLQIERCEYYHNLLVKLKKDSEVKEQGEYIDNQTKIEIFCEE